MRINLSEIPEEGRSYTWSHATGEVNQILKDLIGDTPYITEFFIKPLNHKDYQMTGHIRTELPELCSRCGKDIDFPINEKFHEILIPALPPSRTGKYAKVNHVTDSDWEGTTSVSEYENQSFEMGEFLHEIVGLATPFNPAGPEDCDGNCSIYKIPVRDHLFSYDEEMVTPETQKPFKSLKDLKLS